MFYSFYPKLGCSSCHVLKLRYSSHSCAMLLYFVVSLWFHWYYVKTHYLTICNMIWYCNYKLTKYSRFLLKYICNYIGLLLLLIMFDLCALFSYMYSFMNSICDIFIEFIRVLNIMVFHLKLNPILLLLTLNRLS